MKNITMRNIKIMKTVSKGVFGLIALFGITVAAVQASHNSGGGSASASLSTDTVNIAVGENGSWRISGNDGGSSREFRWSLPSGLSVSAGSSSGMDRFRVRADRGYFQAQTAGNGSFSGTVNVSSNSAGSYTMSNTRAEISLSPRDVTVNVSGSGGGSGGGMDGGGMGGGGAGAGGAIPVIDLDAGNVTLVVRQIQRTMNDGTNLNFWVFCEGGMADGGGMGAGCTLPSPILEMSPGTNANVTLNMMMAPQEAAPYNGHTIHHHGVDVASSEDGVPETGAAILGDNYTFSVDNRYIGGHMYHCHQHTVKHLEMGMFGALIVKSGNQINSGGPTYDFEWNMVLSTVDPAYHSNNAVGDSTVFADYNPKYFMINGQEGLSRGSPAETLTAAPGARVAIRLIGIQSTNSTFRIRDSGGSSRSFTLHNIDGFTLPSPRSVSKLEVSPGQTKDIMVTLPSGSGTWYPEVSYGDLRNNSTYNNGRVYTRLDY